MANCPNCGSPVEPSAVSCPNCGQAIPPGPKAGIDRTIASNQGLDLEMLALRERSLQRQATNPEATRPSRPSLPPAHRDGHGGVNLALDRPEGVTIIAILLILGGLASLFFGALALVVAGDISSGSAAIPTTLAGISSSDVIDLIYVIAVGFVVSGLVEFWFALGLLRGKNWARLATIVLEIIVLIQYVPLFIVAGDVLAFVGIALTVITIYYLTRSDVKAYFKQVNPSEIGGN